MSERGLEEESCVINDPPRRATALLVGLHRTTLIERGVRLHDVFLVVHE